MSVTATIWNFVIKYVDSFRFTITRIGKWFFKVSQLAWRFKVTQQDDWHFIVKPSTYWILREGFWDDDGIWVDSEVWKDS